MILLVVVAVVLFLLTVGLITVLASIARRPDTKVEPQRSARITGSGSLDVGPEPGPMTLVPDGSGDYLSWNDLVFQQLKAHYPDLDGSINDYLYRYQQDNS